MKNLFTCLFTLIFVLYMVVPSNALPIAVKWQAGRLERWDKTILEGELSYNWAAEMVSLRQADGRVYTYSANQVARFGWFDYSVHKLRNFVSLAKPLDKDRTNQVFFEVCLDGSLTVVRRMRQPHGILKRWFSHPSHATDQPIMAQNTDHFDYFVYDAGQLLNLDRYYQDIYTPLMITYDRELNHYIQRHSINDRSLSGRLVIINRYNWLVQSDTKAASNKGYVHTLN